MPGRIIGGTYWPSVTETLDATGLGPRFPGIPADRRGYYLARGRAVALAIHLDQAGELDEASVHPDIAPFLAGARRFCLERPHEVVASEVELRDQHWRILGHPDQVIRLLPDRRLILVDFKLSWRPHPAAIQLAGYAHLWEAEGREALAGSVIIELMPDAYKMHHLDDLVTAHRQTFAAAVVLYRALERMGRLDNGRVA